MDSTTEPTVTARSAAVAASEQKELPTTVAAQLAQMDINDIQAYMDQNKGLLASLNKNAETAPTIIPATPVGQDNLPMGGFLPGSSAYSDTLGYGSVPNSMTNSPMLNVDQMTSTMRLSSHFDDLSVGASLDSYAGQAFPMMYGEDLQSDIQSVNVLNTLNNSNYLRPKMGAEGQASYPASIQSFPSMAGPHLGKGPPNLGNLHKGVLGGHLPGMLSNQQSMSGPDKSEAGPNNENFRELQAEVQVLSSEVAMIRLHMQHFFQTMSTVSRNVEMLQQYVYEPGRNNNNNNNNTNRPNSFPSVGGGNQNAASHGGQRGNQNPYNQNPHAFGAMRYTHYGNTSDDASHKSSSIFSNQVGQFQNFNQHNARTNDTPGCGDSVQDSKKSIRDEIVNSEQQDNNKVVIHVKTEEFTETEVREEMKQRCPGITDMITDVNIYDKSKTLIMTYQDARSAQFASQTLQKHLRDIAHNRGTPSALIKSVGISKPTIIRELRQHSQRVKENWTEYPIVVYAEMPVLGKVFAEGRKQLHTIRLDWATDAKMNMVNGESNFSTRPESVVIFMDREDREEGVFECELSELATNDVIQRLRDKGQWQTHN